MFKVPWFQWTFPESRAGHWGNWSVSSVGLARAWLRISCPLQASAVTQKGFQFHLQALSKFQFSRKFKHLIWSDINQNRGDKLCSAPTWKSRFGYTFQSRAWIGFCSLTCKRLHINLGTCMFKSVQDGLSRPKQIYWSLTDVGPGSVCFFLDVCFSFMV